MVAVVADPGHLADLHGAWTHRGLDETDVDAVAARLDHALIDVGVDDHVVVTGLDVGPGIEIAAIEAGGRVQLA